MSLLLDSLLGLLLEVPDFFPHRFDFSPCIGPGRVENILAFRINLLQSFLHGLFVGFGFGPLQVGLVAKLMRCLGLRSNLGQHSLHGLSILAKETASLGDNLR
jgi:hypothetical protein